jgi:hypothetical protein
MVLSQEQHAAQNCNIQIGIKSLGRVKQFRYLGTTLTNQNSIREEIKDRLNSGNAYCHLVQNLVFQFAVPQYKDQHIQNYDFGSWVGR